MPYTVSILRRAEADVMRIYRWLGKRSPTGANRWYEALESTIDQLAIDAHRNPLAAESASSERTCGSVSLRLLGAIATAYSM
jgi:plasmid stabilization system protein ParE